jgi:nicotinamidase-related amidase
MSSSTLGTLSLTGRYYNAIPMSQAKYVTEPIELDAGKTALVVLHCWNIGCEGGNPVNDNYFIGMGFPETSAEAERIMKERIYPAVQAARKAGILVCHVETSTTAGFHPEMQEEADPPSTPEYAPGPVVKDWRMQMAYRHHGYRYDEDSAYAHIDRAPLLMPEPGEPFVYQTNQFDRILRKRGIENLIYAGFATDMCILRSPGGIEPMAVFSYRVFMMRDATLGAEMRDTFEERIATRWGIRYFETHYGDTIETDDFMNACQSLGADPSGSTPGP